MNKANQAKQLFVKTPVRNFQTFGRTWMTGFDRMLYDKLSYFKVYGLWFALFGIGNALTYVASKFMSKDQFNYMFAYTGGPARLF